MGEVYENTDTEIWRETKGDYYSPSIHFTANGLIGINVGGKVIVKSIQGWHLLAREQIGTYKTCKCGKTELDDGMSLPITKCKWCGERFEDQSEILNVIES